MTFAVGLVLGGMAAWLVVGLFQTSWEDIFPNQ